MKMKEEAMKNTMQEEDWTEEAMEDFQDYDPFAEETDGVSWDGCRDFWEAFREELGDSDAQLQKIGTPSEEGEGFRMPEDLMTPGYTTNAFQGVILYHHAMNFLFDGEYTGEKRMPVCWSYDGKNGEGKPGRACKGCDKNRFSSGENGKGKACRNKRRVYVLAEGRRLPEMISIPTGSLGYFYRYVTYLVERGLRPSQMVTRFTVVTGEKDGRRYPQILLTPMRQLNPEEEAIMAEMGALVKEYAREARVEEYEEE